MADVINITEYAKKEDGQWMIFTDPVTESVHVVPMGLIENWFMDKVKIEAEEHHQVIRAILLEWYNFRFNQEYDL
jgi:RIO-like serine/threonine protein kinase